jgi:hypothetical protein
MFEHALSQEYSREKESDQGSQQGAFHVYSLQD